MALYLPLGIMNEKQRELFAKGMVDLANLAAAALIFGQFVSGLPFNFRSMSLGFISACALYLGGYLFSWGIPRMNIK